MKASEEMKDRSVALVSKFVGNRTKLLYALAISMDVLANSIDQSIKAVDKNACFIRESKRLFGKYSEAAKSVDVWYEKMAETTILESVKDWREYEGYKQDANEILRLIMLYLNATPTSEDYEKVMNLLISMQPEEGKTVFSSKEISRFSFISNDRRG